jgi:hypothetical protein
MGKQRQRRRVHSFVILSTISVDNSVGTTVPQAMSSGKPSLSPNCLFIGQNNQPIELSAKIRSQE